MEATTTVNSVNSPTLAGLGARPLLSHGRHVQSTQYNRGLRVVPAVTLALCCSLCSLMRRGEFPHGAEAATRQGRRRRCAGEPEQQARDFQVRLACFLMQVGDERGGWSLMGCAVDIKGTDDPNCSPDDIQRLPIPPN